MFLFNIVITESGDVALEDLSDAVQAVIASGKHAYPSLSHTLFDNAKIEAAIAESFPAKVLRAYRKLIPFSYKADLAKYCLLYAHGGVYHDLSYYIVKPFSGLGHQPVVFRDFMWASPWDTSVGLIYMPPRSGAMQKAISAVCQNVERGYYGKNSLCPTGPALFGKVLAKYYNPEDLICGMAVWKPAEALGEYPVRHLMDPELNPVHCQSLGDDVVAIKIKRGGVGVKSIGIVNGNSYNELWDARGVYKGDFSLANAFYRGRRYLHRMNQPGSGCVKIT